MPDREAYWLKDLIIGNSSHAHYLQAGLGGNGAGAVYRIGPPLFTR